MSEVNGSNFNFNQVNFKGIQKNAAANEGMSVSEDNTSKITDFSDTRAEAIGRSMLIKDTDGLNNDLKALIDNPQIAENSDKMFETAYAAAQAAGIENPYEEAATASTVSM